METVLYKALVASNAPDEHATAVIEAMEKEMTSTLASKTDLSTVRTELKADIAIRKILHTARTISERYVQPLRLKFLPPQRYFQEPPPGSSANQRARPLLGQHRSAL